jgi:hypothetical protein
MSSFEPEKPEIMPVLDEVGKSCRDKKCPELCSQHFVNRAVQAYDVLSHVQFCRAI